VNDVSRPKTFGVFKPVGHVVVALPTEADRHTAELTLAGAGFADDAITVYSPAQMIAQVEDNLAHASALAGLGQELNLVKAHGALARLGHHFLVVRAPDQQAADTIAEIAGRCHASRAQRYGSLLIEELIPVGASDHQVAESSDRGLDAQTQSGDERPRRAALLR